MKNLLFVLVLLTSTATMASEWSEPFLNKNSAVVTVAEANNPKEPDASPIGLVIGFSALAGCEAVLSIGYAASPKQKLSAGFAITSAELIMRALIDDNEIWESQETRLSITDKFILLEMGVSYEFILEVMEGDMLYVSFDGSAPISVNLKGSMKQIQKAFDMCAVEENKINKGTSLFDQAAEKLAM